MAFPPKGLPKPGGVKHPPKFDKAAQLAKAAALRKPRAAPEPADPTVASAYTGPKGY